MQLLFVLLLIVIFESDSYANSPLIDTAVIPSDVRSCTVPIYSFTAHDPLGWTSLKNYPLTGYLIKEGSALPAINDPNWYNPAQHYYTLQGCAPGVGAGTKTLYFFARSYANEITSPGISRSTVLSWSSVSSYVGVPPGFNTVTLISDYSMLGSSMVGLIGLLVAYRVYKRAVGV